MAVTVRDIANIVGCSRTTVSLALREDALTSRRVSKKIIYKIRKAAEDLGYRPNKLVAALRRKETNIIGVLVSTLEFGISRKFKTIKEVIYPEYSCLLAVHYLDGKIERRELETFIHYRVDGVIAAYTGDLKNEEIYREMFYERNITVVLIDRPVPGLDLPIIRWDY